MLQFDRPELLSQDQAARLHERTKHLLQEVGMKVCHAGTLEQLRQHGFAIRGNRAIQGLWLGEEQMNDYLAQVKAGVESGFMLLDNTLDNFQRDVWYPRRFHRSQMAPWLKAGRPQLSAQLRTEARRRITRHSFALDPDRARQIENICASAEKAILG